MSVARDGPKNRPADLPGLFRGRALPLSCAQSAELKTVVARDEPQKQNPLTCPAFSGPRSALSCAQAKSAGRFELVKQSGGQRRAPKQIAPLTCPLQGRALPLSCAQRRRGKRFELVKNGVVARDGIEPPTPAFSGPRSTTELSGLSRELHICAGSGGAGQRWSNSTCSALQNNLTSIPSPN